MQMIASSSQLSDLGDTGRHIRVLMVEDDKYYFEFVRQLLIRRSNPSFELTRALSLQDAISRLQEEIPDIILLDLNLPDSKGLISLAKVKENCESCPIVILTSADDDSLGIKAVTCGAHDFLVKQNVGNDSLVRCIRYAIERRRAEEQTLRLAVIQDFIGTLAHDLRIPLLGADKLLDALLGGSVGTLSDNQQHLLQALRDSNANQLVLVHRLLQIYRYESGTTELTIAPLELASMVEGTLLNLAETYKGKIVFQNNLPDKSVMLHADREALNALMSNLLDNATTFSPQDKPVTVTLSMRGSRLAIDVHNFGAAIPQEIQNNLFQKFWQGVPGKRYVAHTGLGLYLCHRIVQMHHGRIFCTSEDVIGTTITVILPLQPGLG